jgi:hypothetical protein
MPTGTRVNNTDGEENLEGHHTTAGGMGQSFIVAALSIGQQGPDTQWGSSLHMFGISVRLLSRPSTSAAKLTERFLEGSESKFFWPVHKKLFRLRAGDIIKKIDNDICGCLAYVIDRIKTAHNCIVFLLSRKTR